MRAGLRFHTPSDNSPDNRKPAPGNLLVQADRLGGPQFERRIHFSVLNRFQDDKDNRVATPALCRHNTGPGKPSQPTVT